MSTKKTRWLAAALAAALLAGCAAQPAGTSGAQSEPASASSAPAVSAPSASEPAPPASDSQSDASGASEAAQWRALSDEEAAQLWQALGAIPGQGSGGVWYFEPNEDNRVALFPQWDDELRFAVGLAESEMSACYTVGSVETDGEMYCVRMASGWANGGTGQDTPFEEPAAPFLTIDPGEEGDGLIEMAWSWPAAVEYLTGEQAEDEMTGETVALTAVRAPGEGESAEGALPEQAFAFGGWHQAGVQLEAGFASPKETTGALAFRYKAY